MEIQNYEQKKKSFIGGVFVKIRGIQFRVGAFGNSPKKNSPKKGPQISVTFGGLGAFFWGRVLGTSPKFGAKHPPNDTQKQKHGFADKIFLDVAAT